MAKQPTRRGRIIMRPLVQPNLHPPGNRIVGQKPAGRALAQPIGGGAFVITTGGSRPKV